MRRSEFARDKCGITLWVKYEQIYQLLDMGVQNILIRSCNGAGKSTLLASLIAYEVSTFDDLQIICTAANSTQLRQTLWRAVRRLSKKAGLDVSNLHNDGWEFKPGVNVHPITPSKIESAQGFHAKRVVVMIDEATGLDHDKFQALMSNATGEDSVCIFSYNPIKADAAVYDIEQKCIPFDTLLDEEGEIVLDRVRTIVNDRAWVSIGISAFEHPNVVEGREVIEGAVTREFVERQLRVDSVECHPLHQGAIALPWSDKAFLPTPEAMARVCGEWSQTQAIGFISGSVVVNSWKVEPKSGLRVAGADIGAGDDPSVWTHFRGNQQIDFQQLKTSELNVVAIEIDKYCREHDISVLAVDDTGVGHGVTDRLNELKPPYLVIPVHFGATPKHFPEVALRRPANARCEMYLLLEKVLRNQQYRLLYDKQLQRELCCQKIEGYKQSDMIRLEDKSLIKKRLGHSPNKADATALALYGGRLMQFYNRPRMY